MLGHTNEFGHQLSLRCPFCGNEFAIYVNLHGLPKGLDVWGLTFPPNTFDWNQATITPSISNHPLPKGKVCNQPHFSIINGEIIP